MGVVREEEGIKFGAHVSGAVAAGNVLEGRARESGGLLDAVHFNGAFYTSNKLPKWKGDVFVGGMRYGEIPGTGRLHRILFKRENGGAAPGRTAGRSAPAHSQRPARGPDELIYLLTDADDGAVLRIEPAP